MRPRTLTAMVLFLYPCHRRQRFNTSKCTLACTHTTTKNSNIFNWYTSRIGPFLPSKPLLSIVLSVGELYNKILEWSMMEALNELCTVRMGFYPFPNKPLCLRFCSKSLSKTLWEKEKLLVTSNFSFSRSFFFNPFGELYDILIKHEIVVCKLFQFGRVLNGSFGTGLIHLPKNVELHRPPQSIIVCVNVDETTFNLHNFFDFYFRAWVCHFFLNQ